MKFISKNFKKTFVIAGNHEYYNTTKTIQETNYFLEDYFQQFDNNRFLNNNYEIYENYCFIGTTLWSKITNPNYEINDMYSIPNFDYIQYNKLNRLSVDFLQDTLQKSREMRPYNQWFYCDMDEFIEMNASKIKCWIYGHTHTPSNVIIHKIPFLCNPIGYPNENSILDFQKTFTVK